MTKRQARWRGRRGDKREAMGGRGKGEVYAAGVEEVLGGKGTRKRWMMRAGEEQGQESRWREGERVGYGALRVARG